MLLALLGTWLLGLMGVGLRARLVALLALIAVYVPVAGASPSIQRAGIMGAAALIAMLAGRPRSRWYAVLLAAATHPVAQPAVGHRPGWQLSFAAVIGILLFARAIRDLILGHRGASAALGCQPCAGRGRRRHHRGDAGNRAAVREPLRRRIARVAPGNLLALPAVPPMMWLGMLASIVGQVPGVPVAPLTALAGLLAAYVAQVAHWLAAPEWARIGIELRGGASVLPPMAPGRRRRRTARVPAPASSRRRSPPRRAGGRSGRRRPGCPRGPVGADRRRAPQRHSQGCASWCWT